MQKRWTAKATPDRALVEELSSAINLNKVLTGILVQRGVDTFEKAKSFFRPQYTDLHDPFIMKGMKTAIERIDTALAETKNIGLWGL